MKNQTTFSRTLGTRDVMVAGVALVVAASSLVSNFNGYFSLGISFVVAVLLGFLINLLLGLSAAERSTAYPKAGALYNYAREIFTGNTGKFLGVFIFCFFTFYNIPKLDHYLLPGMGKSLKIIEEEQKNLFLLFIESQISSVYYFDINRF